MYWSGCINTQLVIFDKICSKDCLLKESTNLSFFLGGFFSRESSASCYCDTCYSYGSNGHLSKGEPPSLYSVPTHWARLPLRRKQRSFLEIDQWHIAFVGTSLGTVRRILDLGDLLTPGALVITWAIFLMCQESFVCWYIYISKGSFQINLCFGTGRWRVVSIVVQRLWRCMQFSL